jgi:hypothetical protein
MTCEREHERAIRVGDDFQSINYGPVAVDAEEWSLFIRTADGERLELRLGEAAMYELWTEVQGRPWPDRHEEHETQRTLRHEIVDRVNGMDVGGLREVLDVIEAIERGER